MDDNFFPAFRPKNWQDTTDLRKMRDYSRPMDPEPQTREGDGLIVHSCDEYWHYRFDLMMDAELALSNFLELLVEYHQTRLLEAFLLGVCDVFEMTVDGNPDRLPRFCIRVDFSDRISFEYSTHHIGCLIWIDSKQDSLHEISIGTIDSLRHMIQELLPRIREHPIWDVIKQDGSTVILRRRPLL